MEFNKISKGINLIPKSATETSINLISIEFKNFSSYSKCKKKKNNIKLLIDS